MTAPPTAAPPRHPLAYLLWPEGQLPAAVEALARAAGLYDRAHAPLAAVPPEPTIPVQSLARLGLDAALTRGPYTDAARLIRAAAPGLLGVTHAATRQHLALLRCRGDRVWVLPPAGPVRRLSLAAACELACFGAGSLAATAVDRLLTLGGVPQRRRRGVLATMLRELVATQGNKQQDLWAWRLRPAARRPFWDQLRFARFPARVLAMAAAAAAAFACGLLATAQLGRGALQGRIDPGWLPAWALLLLTAVPLQLVTTWLAGGLLIDASGLLQRRLLAGTLQLDEDATRRDGFGRLMGRVIESQALESLATTAGIAALLAVVNLVLAGLVLLQGSRGPTMVALLGAWVAALVALGARYAWPYQQWTDARIEITHALIEKMLGYRTRLAQLPPERWHEGEDAELEHYLRASTTLDARLVALVVWLPNAWLVVALGVVVSGFVSGTTSVVSMAISLGGTLLAQGTLRALTAGSTSLVVAWTAWARVRRLFAAAARPPLLGTSAAPLCEAPAARPPGAPDPAPVLLARNLRFGYASNPTPVFDGTSLAIAAGERVLVEGPSGSGKSTLIALLAGVRAPQAGLLLLHGLDLASLGSYRWRRSVVVVPQFHENHVFNHTLAFNLLMGRGWPPDEAAVAEAEEVCRELGLGDLLARMPNQLHQVVGETGWQLSHGERSRVFIARALLQAPDVVILDESLGALDPTTHEQVLQCVLRRAKTLVLIAHP